MAPRGLRIRRAGVRGAPPVDAEAAERLVRDYLDAFNRRRPLTGARLAAPDITIRLPAAGGFGGREHRGRTATGRLLLRVLWHSRGTLRMEPRSIEADDGNTVIARTHNTAHRGKERLDLEMTLRFEIRHGRIAAMEESVEDLDSWRTFWA